MYACTLQKKEGMTLAKRRDVAQLAGVSEATVSRVFNNVGSLREETKKKVFEAAKVLNYQPNAIARSFATGKSGNIGVIVPYLPRVNLLSTDYFSEILGGIGEKLGENKYNLLLLFQSPHEPKDYVQLFHSQKIEGCIILGASDTPGERKAINNIHERDLPYCLINQTFAGYPFHSIDADHYKGSFEAVTFMLKKGVRRIAFVNGPKEYSNSVERMTGYQDALLSEGIEPRTDWVFDGNYSRTSGVQTAGKIKSLIPELDAVFAGNDRMAIGLMQGLYETGYHVSKDYALMGYDDSTIAQIVQPQLSSVRVPLFEMGQLAAKKVLDFVTNGKSEPIQVRLPVQLIERESTNMTI